MALSRLLIANRGEIAIRIARAAADLGLSSVAVYAEDDRDSLHVRRADQAQPLTGSGAAAYLDIEQLLAAARRTGCDAVHPGYGFLAESGDFARRTIAAGLAFVGPTPELLDLFGDKVRARKVARESGLPVLEGSAVTTADEARAFLRDGSPVQPVLLKAVAGGGGRGIRLVQDADELDQAWTRAASEAKAAFGNDALYLERFLPCARHIEVQIAGDGQLAIGLGERDCSLQRRHQKLVEIAPAPGLPPPLREKILAAALTLAREVDYQNLGTFEFLVDASSLSAQSPFAFIEANARLQVEHTVTEEVTGIDLVQLQIQLAAGHDLASLGLGGGRPVEVRGCAIQARVNLETMDADGTPRPSTGTLTVFEAPAGPGIRVDSFAYSGYRTSPNYDSLLAKIIAFAPTGFTPASQRLQRALAELRADGVPTNSSFLRTLLARPEVEAATFDTKFVDAESAALVRSLPEQSPSLGSAPNQADIGQNDDQSPAPVGSTAVRTPLPGKVVSLAVREGDRVSAGQLVAVVESMKMEHEVHAPIAGCVRQMSVGAGAGLVEGQVLLFLDPDEGRADDAVALPEHARAAPTENWQPELDEIARRKALAARMGGEERVARHVAAGRLPVRERVEELLDRDSFRETGSLAGKVVYDKEGKIESYTPSNFVTGRGTIDGRRVVIGCDDFTVRGGAADGAVGNKMGWSEKTARELRLPIIRLVDGTGGGGSVKTNAEIKRSYVPANPDWDIAVALLSEVPVVAASLGPVAGLGAARVAASHFSVMVRDSSQLFVAGPPVVARAFGREIGKEELGGAHIHARESGAVDNEVANETEAFAQIRRFLSYLPTSVWESPPCCEPDDDPERREEALLSLVPRDRRKVYDMRHLLGLVLDGESFFEMGRHFGRPLITGLARLDGIPVGVMANDPAHFAGSIDADAGEKMQRFVDLCDTFHLPIANFVDNPGFLVGTAAERRGTIRKGVRALVAVFQATVPWCSIIVRKAYGVAGAGHSNHTRSSPRYAWPSGEWGSLPIEGGVEAAYKRVIAASADPDAKRRELEANLESLRNPILTAESFGVEELIDPRDTRPLLVDWARRAFEIVQASPRGPKARGMRP